MRSFDSSNFSPVTEDHLDVLRSALHAGRNIAGTGRQSSLRVHLDAHGLPAFVAETKFSGDAFRLFRWRSPETRMQIYLETVLAREDHAKEVKLYGLGPRLLERYRDIFRRLYKEDRALTIRRDAWGFDSKRRSGRAR